jgi:hypothetical protein
MKDRVSFALSVLFLMAATYGSAALAGTPPPASPTPSGPKGCDTSESHQWDFWVGYWEVRPRGADKIIAHSLIEKRYAGCAIRENWMPVGKETSGGGGSLSLYDPKRKEWRQTWVDSTGTRVDLDGRFRDDVMTITGSWENFVAPGKDALVAMHYHLEPDGQVRQWAEASTDQGKTWMPSFDFLYRRVTIPSASVVSAASQ